MMGIYYDHDDPYTEKRTCSCCGVTLFAPKKWSSHYIQCYDRAACTQRQMFQMARAFHAKKAAEAAKAKAAQLCHMGENI